jgi:uncharacterized protein (DUF3820 family)
VALSKGFGMMFRVCSGSVPTPSLTLTFLLSTLFLLFLLFLVAISHTRAIGACIGFWVWVYIAKIPGTSRNTEQTSREVEALRLRFGRYRGFLLSDVPVSYLRWLRKQPGILPELKEAIGATLGIKPKRSETHRRPAIDGRALAAGPDL